MAWAHAHHVTTLIEQAQHVGLDGETCDGETCDGRPSYVSTRLSSAYATPTHAPLCFLKQHVEIYLKVGEKLVAFGIPPKHFMEIPAGQAHSGSEKDQPSRRYELGARKELTKAEQVAVTMAALDLDLDIWPADTSA